MPMKITANKMTKQKREEVKLSAGRSIVACRLSAHQAATDSKRVNNQVCNCTNNPTRHNYIPPGNRPLTHLLPLFGLIIINLLVTNSDSQFLFCQARSLASSGKSELPTGMLSASSLGSSSSSSSSGGQDSLASLAGLAYGSSPLEQLALTGANNWPQQQIQPEMVIFDRTAMDYAIEMGCRNLADTILSTRNNGQQFASLAMSPIQQQQQQQQIANLRASKALELLELAEQERIKKASAKHTPRFG